MKANQSDSSTHLLNHARDSLSFEETCKSSNASIFQMTPGRTWVMEWSFSPPASGVSLNSGIGLAVSSPLFSSLVLCIIDFYIVVWIFSWPREPLLRHFGIQAQLGFTCKSVPSGLSYEEFNGHNGNDFFSKIFYFLINYKTKMAQQVKNPPAMKEIQVMRVPFLGGEDPLE